MSGHASRRWSLEEQAFSTLLARLDPDRERAGQEYESIRRRLVRMFLYRDCFCAEDLADQTLDRVARRLAEGEEVLSVGAYCHGVAIRIFKEWLRTQAVATARAVERLPADRDPDAERRDAALTRCLGQLAPDQRRLVLGYYAGDGGERIENRSRLADAVGISMNVLRVRVHRLRLLLEECLRDRLADR